MNRNDIQDGGGRTSLSRPRSMGWILAILVAFSPPVSAADSEKSEKGKAGETKAHEHAGSKTDKGEQKPLGNHFLAASTLIGYTVKGENEERVGRVHDLMVDAEKEESPFMVVSFGGILGVGDELFAVPWEGVKHDHKDQTCVLSIRKEPVVPSEDKKDWIGLDEAESEAFEQSKFALTPYWVRKEEAEEARRSDPSPSPKLLSANELIGSEIQNPEGEKLGYLNDLILGSESGRIVCSVLSFGGFAGVGDKLTPVPTSLLELKGDERFFVLDVDKETIVKAPSYDPKKEGKSMDREWVLGIHRHYDLELDDEATKRVGAGAVKTSKSQGKPVQSSQLSGAKVSVNQ